MASWSVWLIRKKAAMNEIAVSFPNKRERRVNIGCSKMQNWTGSKRNNEGKHESMCGELNDGGPVYC